MSEISSIPSLNDLLAQNNGSIAGKSLLRPQNTDTASGSQAPLGLSSGNQTFLAQPLSGVSNSSPIASDMAKVGLPTNMPSNQASASTNSSIKASASGRLDAPGFREMFEGLIKGVHEKKIDAADKKRDILLGKSDNIHEAMVSAQEAGVAFNLMVQVRNKLVDSYKELLRMRV